MKVIVYTVATCKYSAEEKAYLKSQNIAFEEKDVEEDHEALETMLKVGNNFAGTPVTQIVKDDGSQIVLKGFTQSEFDEAFGIVAQTPSQTLTPPAAQAPAAPVAPEPAVAATPTTQPTTLQPLPATSPDMVTQPAPTQMDTSSLGAPQLSAPSGAMGIPAQAPLMQVVEPAGGGMPPNPLDNILKDLQGQIASTTPAQPTPSMNPPTMAPVPVAAPIPPMQASQQAQPVNAYMNPMEQVNVAPTPAPTPFAATPATYQQRPPIQQSAPAMPSFPNPQ